jgi:hypothetical protein
MKFTAKRLLSAGVIGVAAIVAPLSFTVFSSGPSAVAAPAGSSCVQTPNVDQICYVQTSGSTGTYIAYQAGSPAGVKQTTQSVTSGGGCASPTISGPGDPILPFQGWVYAADAANDYSGGRTSAPVTADKQRTGVCGDKGSGVQPWSIDNVAGVGAEALDFLIGDANSPEGANRLFSEAQIYIANNNANAGTQVTLVESLNKSGVPNGPETQVGEQTFCLGASATVLTDTSGNGACAVPMALGNTPFDTVEIQVQVGGTVSVVEGAGGPSVFTLAQTLCATNPPTYIHPSGAPAGVTAPLSVTQGCKTWTTYTYGTDPNTGDQLLDFNAFSSNPVPFTFTVTWAPVPACQPIQGNNPYPGSPPPLTTCPLSEFSFDGTKYFDTNFCVTPTLAEPVCVTSDSYTLTPDGKSTVIKETWNALADLWGRT